MLIAWMVVIFLFSHQPASASSKISGTFSFRLLEQADEILRLGMAENDIEKMAERIDYPVRKAAHMTEYAILLAFVAAIAAGVFVFDWSQSDWNEDGTLKGNSLGTAIYSGIFNAGAAIQRIIRDI